MCAKKVVKKSATKKVAHKKAVSPAQRAAKIISSITKVEVNQVENKGKKVYTPPADPMILYKNSWFFIIGFGVPGNKKKMAENEAEIKIKVSENPIDEELPSLDDLVSIVLHPSNSGDASITKIIEGLKIQGYDATSKTVKTDVAAVVKRLQDSGYVQMLKNKVSLTPQGSQYVRSLVGDDEETERRRKDCFEASKILLKSPELKAVKAFDNKVRQAVFGFAVESPFNRAGIYLIPKDAYPIARDFLKKKQGEREILVQKFMDVYPARREEAKVDLGAAYDPSDYPNEHKMRSKFRMEWKVRSMDSPKDIESLGEAIEKEEREKYAEEARDTCSEVAYALRSGFKTALDRIIQALKPSESGKRGRLFDSNIESLLQFLETFGAKNALVQDEDTAKLVEAAKSLVKGKDADYILYSCRKNADFRETILKKFEEIAAEAEELVVEDESREILL